LTHTVHCAAIELGEKLDEWRLLCFTQIKNSLQLYVIVRQNVMNTGPKFEFL